MASRLPRLRARYGAELGFNEATPDSAVLRLIHQKAFTGSDVRTFARAATRFENGGVAAEAPASARSRDATPAPPQNPYRAAVLPRDAFDAAGRTLTTAIGEAGRQKVPLSKYLSPYGIGKRGASEFMEMYNAAGPLLAGGGRMLGALGRSIVPVPSISGPANVELQQAGKAIGTALPAMAQQFGRDINEELTNPGGAFLKRPLQTTLDVAGAGADIGMVAHLAAKTAARLNATGRFATSADRAAHAREVALAEKLAETERAAEAERIANPPPPAPPEAPPPPATTTRPKGPRPAGPPGVGQKPQFSDVMDPDTGEFVKMPYYGASGTVPAPVVAPKPKPSGSLIEDALGVQAAPPVGSNAPTLPEGGANAPIIPEAKRLAQKIAETEKAQATYKHFTSPEAAEKLRRGESYDPGQSGNHPLMQGLSDMEAAGKSFAPKGSMYLSLDDARWGKRAVTDKTIEAIPSKGRDDLLGDDHFYDYETQQWMVRPGAVTETPLTAVEYGLPPNAKILRIAGEEDVTAALENLGATYVDDLLDKAKLAGYDAVEIHRPDNYEQLRYHKWWKSSGGSQVVVFDPKKAKPMQSGAAADAAKAAARAQLLETATKKRGSKTRWKAMRKAGANNEALEAALRSEGVDPAGAPVDEWRQALAVGHPNRILPAKELGATAEDLIIPEARKVAVKMKDGSVVDGEATMHGDLVESKGINPDDIESTGFTTGGKYEGGPEAMTPGDKASAFEAGEMIRQMEAQRAKIIRNRQLMGPDARQTDIDKFNRDLADIDDAIAAVKASKSGMEGGLDLDVEAPRPDAKQGVPPDPTTGKDAAYNAMRELGMRNPLNEKETVLMTSADNGIAFHIASYGETVLIRSMRALNPKMGAGGSGLARLTEIADEFGTKLMLKAEPFGPGRMSKAKLIAFYKKHGFEMHQGDKELMVREPIPKKAVDVEAPRPASGGAPRPEPPLSAKAEREAWIDDHYAAQAEAQAKFISPAAIAERAAEREARGLPDDVLKAMAEQDAATVARIKSGEVAAAADWGRYMDPAWSGPADMKWAKEGRRIAEGRLAEIRKMRADDALSSELLAKEAEQLDTIMYFERMAAEGGGAPTPKKAAKKAPKKSGPNDLLFPPIMMVGAGGGEASVVPKVLNRRLRKFAQESQKLSDRTSLPNVARRITEYAESDEFPWGPGVHTVLEDRRARHGVRQYFADRKKERALNIQRGNREDREALKGLSKQDRRRMTARLMGLEDQLPVSASLDLDNLPPGMSLKDAQRLLKTRAAELDFRARTVGNEAALTEIGDLDPVQAYLRRFQPLRLREKALEQAKSGARGGIFDDDPIPALKRSKQLEAAGYDPAYVPMTNTEYQKWRLKIEAILPSLGLSTTMKARIQSLLPILQAGTEPGFLKQSKGIRFLSGRYEKDIGRISATMREATEAYLERVRVLNDITSDPKLARQIHDISEFDINTEKLLTPDLFTRRAGKGLEDGGYVIQKLMDSGEIEKAANEMMRGIIHDAPPAEPLKVGRMYAVKKSVWNEMEGQLVDLPEYLKVPFQLAFDTPNTWLRWMVLTARPGFYVNNFMGNSALGALSGTTAKGIKAAAEKNEMPAMVRGSSYASAEAPASTIAGTRFQKITDLPVVMNEGIDDFMREASFHSEVDRIAARKALRETGEMLTDKMTTMEKMDFVGAAGQREAADHINDFFNDYARQSPLQKRFLRRLFPFQSFLVHTMRLAVKLPIKYPKRASVLMRLSKVMDEIKDEEWRLSGIDPATIKDFRKNQLPVGRTPTGQIETVGTVGANPFQGLAMASSPEGDFSGTNVLRDLLSTAAGPAPGWLLSGMWGKNDAGWALTKPGVKRKFGTDEAEEVDWMTGKRPKGQPMKSVGLPTPSLLDEIRSMTPIQKLLEAKLQPNETYDLTGSLFPWEKKYLPSKLKNGKPVPRKYDFGEQFSGWMGFPLRGFDEEEVVDPKKKGASR